jgi:hypothetical protein
MSNQSLELMQHVVIKHFALVLLVVFGDSIVHAQDVVAEGWSHEELLHHRVHIANAPKIFETDILLESSG